MIVAMSASQFYTQRQLMTKNMPTDGPPNPFMQQQKVMLYLFPILFGVFGINFPVGVLLYWLVSNFWSMGQQLFVIRRMPTIGSPAHEALMRRRSKHEASKGAPAKRDSDAPADASAGAPAGDPNGAAAAPGPAGTKPPGRQQPQRQSRSQRSGAKKR